MTRKEILEELKWMLPTEEIERIKNAKTVIYSKDGDIRTENGDPADIEYFGNTSGIQGDKDYMIEIEARPFDTTDLQKVG